MVLTVFSKHLSPKGLFLVGGFFVLTATFILNRRADTVSHEYRPDTVAESRGVTESHQNLTTATLLLQTTRGLASIQSSRNQSAIALRRKDSIMTVGILVAKREKTTIYNLLDHLLREPHVAKDFIIIVHVAYSVSRDEELLRYLRRLKDVVVTVVEEKPYPEAMVENIADTRGDSMERTVWRTTHGEVAARIDVHAHCVYVTTRFST